MDGAFDDVDAVHAVGRFTVRRARPGDAEQYARLDAELVADTYAAVMPPEFGERLFAEVPADTVRLRAELGDDLAAEAAGAEPRRRSWVAFDGPRMVAIAVSSMTPQEWEVAIGAEPVPGVPHQLDHLYLHESAWGTGLADALLRLAVPAGLPAYLWIVGGNERARQFYLRRGFVDDGRAYACGPLWYHRTLYRMVRR